MSRTTDQEIVEVIMAMVKQTETDEQRNQAFKEIINTFGFRRVINCVKIIGTVMDIDISGLS